MLAEGEQAPEVSPKLGLQARRRGLEHDWPQNLAERRTRSVHVLLKHPFENVEALPHDLGEDAERMQFRPTGGLKLGPEVPGSTLRLVEHLLRETTQKAAADGLPDAVEFCQGLLKVALELAPIPEGPAPLARLGLQRLVHPLRHIG